MGVGKSWVSQIEAGKVTTRDMLAMSRPWAGQLSLMADFGDELPRAGGGHGLPGHAG